MKTKENTGNRNKKQSEGVNGVIVPEKENAYLTVEASLLVPVIFMAVVSLIYLSFYLYNNCVLYQLAYTAALRGSLQAEAGSGEIEAYVSRELDELLENRILSSEATEKMVSVNSSIVRVKLQTTMLLPVGGLQLIEDALPLSAEAEADRISPVKFIRGIRKIKKGIDGDRQDGSEIQKRFEPQLSGD